MSFEPGRDRNNNERFRKEREDEQDSPLVRQRIEDEKLVRRLFGDAGHPFIKMLKRQIRLLAVPPGTTTTEFVLMEKGAYGILNGLVDILEKEEDDE